MTPERLEELKAILDEDGYFVTDDIRDLIAEVERLHRLRDVINQNHSSNGYIFAKDLKKILEDTP
jgi:hypothetical protein